jgi:very-short-patch-repair endonuclease
VLARCRPGTSWTRSELEEAFIAFLDAQRIRRGEANAYARANGQLYECDHVWRRERLVVELDGIDYHKGPDAVERDSAKRRALVAACWRVVVVTWRQVHENPAALAAELRALLARAARAPAGEQ